MGICHRKSVQAKTVQLDQFGYQNWSSGLILVDNLVWPDQFWYPKLVRPDQKRSGPSYALKFDAVRHCMPTAAAEKEIVDVKVPDVIQR